MIKAVAIRMADQVSYARVLVWNLVSFVWNSNSWLIRAGWFMYSYFWKLQFNLSCKFIIDIELLNSDKIENVTKPVNQHMMWYVYLWNSDRQKLWKIIFWLWYFITRGATVVWVGFWRVLTCFWAQIVSNKGGKP